MFGNTEHAAVLHGTSLLFGLGVPQKRGRRRRRKKKKKTKKKKKKKKKKQRLMCWITLEKKAKVYTIFFSSTETETVEEKIRCTPGV